MLKWHSGGNAFPRMMSFQMEAAKNVFRNMIEKGRKEIPNYQ
jgi:hypothetical protein